MDINNAVEIIRENTTDSSQDEALKVIVSHIEEIQSEVKVLSAMVNKMANEKVELDKENISLQLLNESLVERLNGMIREMQPDVEPQEEQS